MFRSLRGALPYVFFGMVLVAIVYAVASRRHELADALHRLSWLAVVAAFVFAALALTMMMLSWVAAVRGSGVDLDLRDGLRIYGIGQIGKYLPGSVWPVLTQAQMARKRNYSPVRVASGSLLALAISVCIGLLIGGVLLPFSGHEARTRLWWAPLVAIPLVAVLSPRVLNWLLARVARLARRGEISFQFSMRGLMQSAAWAVLGNLLFGLHILALGHGFGASGLRGYLLSTCAYALASTIGVLIIFVPAGAGAREVVLTAVLAPVLSVSSALLIALVSRVVLIVIDVGLALTQAIGLKAFLNQTTGSAPQEV